MNDLLKAADFIAKAGPAGVFLVAFWLFSGAYFHMGESISLPLEGFIHPVLGMLMVAAGICFFTKILFGYPKMQWVDG